jgi:hypothetical protein
VSSWMIEQGSDIPIWRPSGGEHPLCPPRRLHYTDPALCDYPPCNEDLECAPETGNLRPELPEAGNYMLAVVN